MIIELVGMPGAGKSALARELEMRGVTGLRPFSKWQLITSGLAFFVTHPLSSLRLFAAIRRADPSQWYSLVVNGYLKNSAAYAEARRLSVRGGTVIVDQGFFQLIVSLPRISPSLLRVLPAPDVLAVVKAPRELRNERMRVRGWTPRGYAPPEQEAWDEAAERELERMLPVLREHVRVEVCDGGAPLEATADSLLARLGSVSRVRHTPRSRLLLKTGVALFAYGMRAISRLVSRKPEAVVLMYHAVDRSNWKLAVSPEAFEQQMAYLANRVSVIPLSRIVSYAKQEASVPRRAVAVTFDDGYRDLLTEAFPVLKRYDIPCTIFVPTDMSAKTAPDARPRLSWSELRELAETGLVTVASHAQTHRRLSVLSEAEVRTELRTSADDIERELGTRPAYFAYPYGDRGSVSQRIAGEEYQASFTIHESLVHPGDDLSGIGRVQVDSTMNFLLFRLRLTEAVEWNRAIVDACRRNRMFRLIRTLVSGEL